MSKPNATVCGPLILALDTSSKATSIAVVKRGQLLGSISTPSEERRSEKLWSEIQRVLEGLDLTIHDIDIFAACTGPGGFTGLRVGLAAAKGFAGATSKPLIGVTSLEASALGGSTDGPVYAMVSAYKEEVYSQLFSFDVAGVPTPQNDPMVSTFGNALARVADVSDLVFAGDGALSGAEVIKTEAARSANRKWVIKRSGRCPAECVAEVAFLRYARGETGTAENLRACYVRPAQAELKLSAGLLGSKIRRSMKSQ